MDVAVLSNTSHRCSIEFWEFGGHVSTCSSKLFLSSSTLMDGTTQVLQQKNIVIILWSETGRWTYTADHDQKSLSPKVDLFQTKKHQAKLSSVVQMRAGWIQKMRLSVAGEAGSKSKKPSEKQKPINSRLSVRTNTRAGTQLPVDVVTTNWHSIGGRAR